MVYTHGDNPKDYVLAQNVREELAYIEYEQKEWSITPTPARIVTTLPTVKDGKRTAVRPLSEKQPGLAKMREQVGANSDKITLLRTKEPVKDKNGIYTLDFGGRVTEPSLKNIQLVGEVCGDQIGLQFGK